MDSRLSSGSARHKIVRGRTLHRGRLLPSLLPILVPILLGNACFGDRLSTPQPGGPAADFSDPADTAMIRYSSFPRVPIRALHQEKEPGVMGIRLFCNKASSVVRLNSSLDFSVIDHQSARPGLGIRLCDTVRRMGLYQLMPAYGSQAEAVIDGEKLTLYFQTPVADYFTKEVRPNDPVILYYYHLWFDDFSETHHLLVIEFHAPLFQPSPSPSPL